MSINAAARALRAHRIVPVLCAMTCAACAACASPKAPASARPDAVPPELDTFGCAWTPAQQQIAWAITSVYENNTAVVQYPYCENIDDGRGYTSGRAGFCTGT